MAFLLGLGHKGIIRRMQDAAQNRRLHVLPNTILPQHVPSRVCLTCEVCCRFPESDSFLRPYFTADKIAGAVAHGVDRAQFADLQGCHVSLVPIPRILCREAARSGHEFINTMADSGLPSLARSKTAYHPLRMVGGSIATEP